MSPTTPNPAPRAPEETLPHSGATRPFWGETQGVTYSPLAGPIDADVCIVGAGIAGITTAYLLAKEGKSVVVVDEKPVGGGETGRTSAHLASVLDDRFHIMERKHGEETTRLHYQSHAAAVDLIEQIDRDERLESDFARVEAYLFPADEQSTDELKKEHEAAQRVGIDVSLLEQHTLRGVIQRPCLRFGRQARFQPVRYLEALAQAAVRLGVRIYTGQRVMDLSGNGPVTAKLASGSTINSRFGVAATNVPSPINNWIGIYTKQTATRTYLAALKIPEGAVDDALYWDMDDPYHYVRLHRAPEGLLLLVGGEDHKTGQPGEHEEAVFERLGAWARRWFPAAGEIVYSWSGQVCEPDDGIAFIGRVPTGKHEACFAITGDSGMGLTHGTLGARLIADLIMGRPNPWEEVYRPSRKPFHALGTYISDNANTAVHLAEHLTPGAKEAEIPRGSGAVVREGLKKLATFRDDAGQVHKCSAYCTHLKGVVHWNAIEKTWDCPLHGSRFGCKGEVITGPAVDNLEPHDPR